MTTTTQFFTLLQKFFYQTGNLYLYSFDESGLPTSEWIGTDEEIQYVSSIMDEAGLSGEKAMNYYGIEEIIPVQTTIPYVSMYMIAWKHERRTLGVTYVCAFIEDLIPAGEGVPQCIVRTSQESVEDNINYIVQFGKLLMKTTLQNQGMEKAQEEALEAKHKMEQDYLRSALMTEVVQMLDADGSLKCLAESIFEKVCTHLNIEEAYLYGVDKESKHVDILAGWSKENGCYMECDAEVQRVVDDYPFMNGLTYTISANSKITDSWRDYIGRTRVRAIVTMPITLDQEHIVYVAFQSKNEHKIWTLEETKFLHDVKKIVQSIAAKKNAADALHKTVESMKEILQSIGCCVFVVDEDKNLLFHNERFGADFPKRLRECHALKSLLNGDVKEKEVYLEDSDEWFNIQHTRIQWMKEIPVSLFTVRNITGVKEYEKQMEITINSDFLTGLYNRVRCEADIRLYLEMTQNYGGEGALFFIDLDDFKHINEGLGYQYGDILLKEISSDLRRIPGIESTCYRVGGDEFMVIVANNAYEQMGNIISSIEELFAKPWFIRSTDYYCTMSMGVCRFPTDADTVEDIIRKADAALQEAKKSGKNRVEYYDSNVMKEDMKRLDMEKFMRNACLNPAEEFEVYYQPIVDISLDGNPCVGAEALVRWNSKAMGNMMPSDFIPLAEYLGLINPIGQYVLEEACRHCKFWNDMGHPEYKVNVNFSVVQLLQSEIVESIERVLKRTGINPHNLTVEVTESLAVNDMNYMKRILKGIKKLGVRVALDDFGTGYSSLNHLREMPLDIIKVDRCFVNDLGKDKYAETFIRMVSELAKATNLNVCVEGIENEEQFEIMKKHNINMVQGYYVEKPMPLEDFEEKYLA